MKGAGIAVRPHVTWRRVGHFVGATSVEKTIVMAEWIRSGALRHGACSVFEGVSERTLFGVVWRGVCTMPV